MIIKTKIIYGAVVVLAFSCSPEKKENTGEKAYGKVVTEPKPDTLIAQQQYLIKPGQVGRIKLGILTDSLYYLMPQENIQKKEVTIEGMKSRIFEIRNKKAGDQLLLFAEETCQPACKIRRIRVLNPKFQTADSIRVGSTFGELKKKYPLSYIGMSEADFVAVSGKNRMTFALDISGFPPKPLYKIKAKDIPEKTVVTGILLY